MKPRHLWALALALTCWMAGPAHASWEDFAKPYITSLATKSENGNVPRGLNPSPHFITISPPDWYDSEQAAVSGFSWGTAPDRMIVGGAFRAYADTSPWSFGMVAEALTSPTSNAQIVGAELDVASRNPNSSAAKWGLNVVFFNRFTGPAGAVESGLGTNRYNQNAKAVVIESLPRSTVGEYSGWQTAFYFGRTAFDRTVDKPYAAVIDVSDVNGTDNTLQAQVPLYIVVFRCGQSRCGWKASNMGLELWEMIDTTPRFVRLL
jgi:hypothetical protein